MRRRPDDAEGRRWLAQAYDSLGQGDRAIEHWKVLARIAPGDVEARDRLLPAPGGAPRVEELAVLERQRAADPRDEASRRRLVELYRASGDGPRAIGAQQELAALRPRDHDTLALLGRLLVEQDRGPRGDRRVRAGGRDGRRSGSTPRWPWPSSTSGATTRAARWPCSSASRRRGRRIARCRSGWPRSPRAARTGRPRCPRWIGSPRSRLRIPATPSRRWTRWSPRIACPRRSRASAGSSSRAPARRAPRCGSRSSTSGTTRSARPSRSTRGSTARARCPSPRSGGSPSSIASRIGPRMSCALPTGSWPAGRTTGRCARRRPRPPRGSGASRTRCA